VALKREIIEATLAPGASVSVVARHYDVNANQVSAWRRRYLAAEEALAPTPSLPGHPSRLGMLSPVTA